MKIKKIIIIMIFLIPLSLKSQGFDWQIDPRLPFKSPVFFYGISSEIGLFNNSAELLFSDQNLPCCTFKNGQGYQFSLGGHTEYWFNSNLAYSLDFNLSNIYSTFNGNSDTLPLRTGENFITQYEFISNINSIILEPAVKYRIYDSHFNLGFSLQIGVQYFITSEHNEYVISPNNWPWKSKSITNDILFDLNNIVLNPKISIGYDYSISNGIYLTPSFNYSLPIFSLASDYKWRYQAYNFKLTLNYGAFIYID